MSIRERLYAATTAPNDVTYTVENLECRESFAWLTENGWIE